MSDLDLSDLNPTGAPGHPIPEEVSAPSGPNPSPQPLPQDRAAWARPARTGHNELPTRTRSPNRRPVGNCSPPPRNLPPASPAPAARADLTATAERPLIPAAREATVELGSLPLASPAPVAGNGSARRADSRPAPDDAAAEVWALVERAQKGDAEAFGQIYDRYVDVVFRFIYFRVGSRHQAEDLTSETFARALRRISSVTWQGRDLGAWLVRIARNLVVDHFKSGRYRFEVSAGDVLDADQADRGPEGSPEAAVVEHITNMTLLAAVKRLNREQQECIVLRFLLGYSVAETAHAMGKNEGAIKAMQYRAVRSLHRLLPEGFQP